MRLFFVIVLLSLGFTPAFAQNSNNLTSTITELNDLLSKQIQMLNEIKSSSSCQENECANITSQLVQINDNLLRINNSTMLSGIPNLLFSSISIFIAGIAVVSAYVSAHYSRKQFQQTEKDLKMRFSPRVIVNGPMPSQVVLKDTSVLDYDVFSKSENPPWNTVDHIIFRFHFRNIGGDVAVKMSNIKIIKDEPFDSSEFENKSDFKMGLMLPPNQEFSIHFTVSLERFDTLEQQNLFAGLSIAYEDLAGNKQYSGAIYGIRRGSNYVLHSWLYTNN